MLCMAKGFSHQPLDPVSCYGIAVAPADNQPQAGKFTSGFQVVNSQAGCAMALSMPFDRFEFTRCLDPLDWAQTV